MPNFRIIPERELSYLLPRVEYLKNAERFRSFKNARDKNWCVVSSTGKADLSFGFNDTI